MKDNDSVDETLEKKAVRFLRMIRRLSDESISRFVLSLAPTSSDESLLTFVEHSLIAATMEILDDLFGTYSAKLHFALLNAELIPHIITSLSPSLLPFADCQDIHTHLISFIESSLWIATSPGLKTLQIEDSIESKSVNETILKHILVPSEGYIHHLCANRWSIVDDDQLYKFMRLLARIIGICPQDQPTMDFVLKLPVITAITSAITFCEFDLIIWRFLDETDKSQREWNKHSHSIGQSVKIVRRHLKMEGFDEVIEQRQQNDKNRDWGRHASCHASAHSRRPSQSHAQPGEHDQAPHHRLARHARPVSGALAGAADRGLQQVDEAHITRRQLNQQTGMELRFTSSLRW
ncbi:hypothetical protein BLNAU_7839 [Blattamonas nauphoetae]|uniref:Uncharacterized protein n=1 Tax=Blattamonas nauphoetae TaxID=2049346 RepID=A0ABQ9Y0H6_9EUKA|nr:hypothetical protein BLNAU_7839 [Blattamonas nauphoetae]